MQESDFARSRSSRAANVHYRGVLEPGETEAIANIAGETEENAHIAGETERPKDKGVYVGTDDDMQDGSLSDTHSDGLGDIWNEMTVALECSKVTSMIQF